MPATVVSLRNAVVASELASQVAELPLVPGDRVGEGQVVARLDCADSELALDSARSQLTALDARHKLASQQLERLNKLKQSRSTSEEQISQRVAELAIVKAEIATQTIAINTAGLEVSRCEIHAPFPGVVTRIPGQVGNYLSPGEPVIELVDIDRVELKAALLESQVWELANTDPQFEFAGKSWPLQVRTIFPVVDEATQTREVRFRFNSDKPSPGSIGRLRWQLNGLTIPATYLVSRDDQVGVFVVDSNEATTVRFHAIDDARAGQPATVNADPGLLVVTDGRFGLHDQQEVVIE